MEKFGSQTKVFFHYKCPLYYRKMLNLIELIKNRSQKIPLVVYKFIGFIVFAFLSRMLMKKLDKK